MRAGSLFSGADRENQCGCGERADPLGLCGVKRGMEGTCERA